MPDAAEIKSVLSQNGYEFLEQLGRGGQARVFKVYDRYVNETVALKVFIGEDEDSRARLAQEYAFLRMQEHMHLPKVFDLREARSQNEVYLWFTMELCACAVGSRLSETELALVRRAGSDVTRRVIDEAQAVHEPVRKLHIMELPDRVTRMIEFLDALSFIHDRRIAHRDIKPLNVLLTSAGRVKLADFGTAKKVWQDTSRSFIGTAEYIAPELWRTLDDGGASMADVDLLLADEYSAAITIFQVLSRGRLPGQLGGLGPLAQGNAVQYALVHQSGPFVPLVVPERSETPQALNEVLSRMMQPAPHRRYGNIARCMTEFFTALVRDKLIDPARESI